MQPERYPPSLPEKPDIFTSIPFWLQKGIKIYKFVDANKIFGKYGPWAFQNRSRNVSATSSYDFMPIWSLVKTPKKEGGVTEEKNRHNYGYYMASILDSGSIYP